MVTLHLEGDNTAAATFDEYTKDEAEFILGMSVAFIGNLVKLLAAKHDLDPQLMWRAIRQVEEGIRSEDPGMPD